MDRVFNLALRFETEDAEAFETYSREWAKSVNSDFVLGPRSVPHLTVLQFEANDNSKEKLFRRLRSLKGTKLKLDLAGLLFLPAKDGNVWIEISVLKNAGLTLLQRKAISSVRGAKIHSGIEDNYRPHITVLRALNTRATPPINLDEDVVRRKGVVGHLALGLSGPNYQIEEFVWP